MRDYFLYCQRCKQFTALNIATLHVKGNTVPNGMTERQFDLLKSFSAPGQMHPGFLKIRPGKTPNFRELKELRRNAVTFLQWMKVNNCKIDNCKQSTIKILSITHYHYSVMRVGLREETAISSSVSTGPNTTLILVEKGRQ